MGARGFGDLDVLVSPRAVAALVDAFTAHGWRSSVPLPDRSSWAWRRLLYTSNELTFYGASCSVDLHWRLDPTIDGLPAFDTLWERRETVDLGGVAVSTLGRADALAHLCMNAARDEWRWLRSLVDIHRTARFEGAWESDRLSPLAVRALVVTEDLVGLPAERAAGGARADGTGAAAGAPTSGAGGDPRRGGRGAPIGGPGQRVVARGRVTSWLPARRPETSAAP